MIEGSGTRSVIIITDPDLVIITDPDPGGPHCFGSVEILAFPYQVNINGPAEKTHHFCGQAELKRLAAYKLPQDKVSCIFRVSVTIMNLLSLAVEKSVPAADDFLPVLVYVIIQANPPDLLSTGTATTVLQPHGLINYVDTKVACRLLKKFINKGTLGQVFI